MTAIVIIFMIFATLFALAALTYVSVEVIREVRGERDVIVIMMKPDAEPEPEPEPEEPGEEEEPSEEGETEE